MKERYEQEIEQLLSELESEPADGSLPPAPDDAPPPLDDQPSPFTPRPRPSARLISPGKLALAGVILAVVGLVLPLFKWLSLAGMAIMVVAIVWMFARRWSGAPTSTYWRGRPIDDPPQGTWQRFRRWLSQ